MRKLPRLEFLNGLAIDRDELYSSQEVGADELPPQINMSGTEENQINEMRAEEELKDRGGLMSDQDPVNSSLVEVMEDKHEMFQVRGNNSNDLDQMDQQFMIDNDRHSKIEEQEHSFQAQNDNFENAGKPQVMRQNLIDDEDLANALP